MIAFDCVGGQIFCSYTCVSVILLLNDAIYLIMKMKRSKKMLLLSFLVYKFTYSSLIILLAPGFDMPILCPLFCEVIRIKSIQSSLQRWRRREKKRKKDACN